VTNRGPLLNHRILLAGTSLLIAAALAACSGKAPDAVTISSGAPAATISDNGSPSAEPSTSSARPQPVTPLSKAQLTGALPTAKELGRGGWKVSQASSTPSSSSKDKISPESCRQVYNSLESEVAGTKAASVERDYQASGWGPFVGVTMASYAEVPPDGVFNELAKALSSCPKFTVTDKKGQKTSYVVSPLKFPNVGDQTFAIRMAAKTGTKAFSLTLTIDVAMATKGSTSVLVVNAGIGKLFLPSTTLTAMKAALAGLPS
jgi:hypothetical protein